MSWIVLLELLVLALGALLVGFLDSTEHASLTEALEGYFLSALHSTVRLTPPPVLPPKHGLLGILTSSQL